MTTLADRKSFCLAELTRWQDDLVPALATIPDGPTFEAVRERFVTLLEKMPDPGWRAPTMRAFSTSGALYVAVYLAMRESGADAKTAWSVCEKATASRFARMKGMERSAASSGMFSWPMRFLVRSLEARSKGAPLGGWAARYVPPSESSDYGVDYDRCAIHQLAIDADAAEFAPFICNADAIGSHEFGGGLVRTETLAQGGTRCDFRFKKEARPRSASTWSEWV